MISQTDVHSISNMDFFRANSPISNKYDGDLDKLDSHKYKIHNPSNYNVFEKFNLYVQSNFELKNSKEIINFIGEHPNLIELIEKTTPIIKGYFPNYSLSLEFLEDPESETSNNIILYINGEKDSFDKDWEELRNINKDIRKLNLYDDSVRSLFSVDLW